MELTFTEDPNWSRAIWQITVDGVVLNASEYSITTGIITFAVDVFTAAGSYEITIRATGYMDSVVTQVIKEDSDDGDEEEPEEDIILTISGDGITTDRKFTMTQFEEMEQYQHVYSAINTWPTKKWYVGKGVKLKDLLDEAGIKNSAEQIRFTASDGFTTTLTVQELLKDERYYFPNFKDNDTNLGHIPGSAAGAKEVEPILALESADGTADPDYMNDTSALLLMIGQRAVTEQTGQLFIKNVDEIEVLTDEPEQWDEPQADPDSGSVDPGTLIKLSNKHNDDDKIYYTLDGSTPTLSSPMYNWIASRWWSSREDDLDSINCPIEINSDTTLKAITIGPGKEDSEVVTFSYTVTESEILNNVIATSTGGTVRFGTEVTIEIPAGALPSNGGSVGIQKVAAPPAAPAGFELLSSVYELSVDEQSSFTFAKNVTITISFHPDADSAGELPGIYYYDEVRGLWMELGGTVSGDSVSVQVDHFTKFTVMAAIKGAGPLLTDITGHWAMNSINKLLNLGCISGYPDGTFKPDHTITRAEFATVLVKAYKLEDNGGRVFADTALHWAKDYIATAAANGLVNGYDENIFGPDDLITREQMAVMLVKAAKLTPVSGQTGFADSAIISSWANEAIATAVTSGILRGYPDNTIQPQGCASRAEAVTAVIKAMNKTQVD